MKIADHMPQEAQAGPQQAGLPPARGAMPPEGAPEQMPPEGGGNERHDGEPPTDKEQADYDKVLEAASEVLYGEMSAQVLKLLQSGADDPAQVIADTAVMVILELDQQSGGKIPEVVIIPAAAEIAELVGELAHKNGIFEVNDMVLGKAGQLLLMRLADEYDVEAEDLQEIIQSVDPKQAQAIVAQQSQYGAV